MWGVIVAYFIIKSTIEMIQGGFMSLLLWSNMVSGCILLKVCLVIHYCKFLAILSALTLFLIILLMGMLDCFKLSQNIDNASLRKYHLGFLILKAFCTIHWKYFTLDFISEWKESSTHGMNVWIWEKSR